MILGQSAHHHFAHHALGPLAFTGGQRIVLNQYLWSLTTCLRLPRGEPFKPEWKQDRYAGASIRDPMFGFISRDDFGFNTGIEKQFGDDFLGEGSIVFHHD